MIKYLKNYIAKSPFIFLTKKEKLYLFLFISFAIINGILELISIASIIPLLDVFLNKSDLSENYFDLIDISFLLKINLTLFASLVIIFFIIKYFISFLFQFLLVKYTADIQIRIENTIYQKILMHDYNFFLKKNTSSLLRDIQNCSTSYPRYINSIITIFSEIFLVSILSIFIIFFVDKEIIYVSIFFIPLIFVFLKITKKFVVRIGTSMHYYSKNKIEVIKSSFDGILEVKVFNMNDYVIKIFNKFIIITRRSEMKYNQIQILPKYVLELSLIIMLILVAYLMNLNEVSLDKILIFMAVLFASAFRVTPSLSKIIFSLQTINVNSPVMITLSYYLNFKQNKITRKKNINFISADFKLINFKYSDSNDDVLKNLSLTITKKSKISIQGKSGSGKSTFVKILIGLLTPTSGTFKINGKVRKFSDGEILPNLSYVPQNVYLFDDTILNNIVMPGNKDNINIKKLNIIIKLLLLDNFINSLPNKLNTVIGENGSRISGGQKQRIGIARALYNEPQILILDEATNSIDQISQTTILNNLIKQYSNIAFICISHDPTVIERFNEKYTLNKGSFVKIK